MSAAGAGGKKSTVSGAGPGTAHSTARDFEDGTAYLLARVGAEMRRRWVDAIAELDVTPTQFNVVICLDGAGPVGQRELAELVGIDPRNCGPVVDALEERGLLTRETDEGDRRRRVLSLSKQGKKLAGDLEAANAGVEDELRKLLGPKDHKALRDALLRIPRPSL